MRRKSLRIVGSAIAALLVVQSIDLPLSLPLVGSTLDLGTTAEAKRSGGRSGGGSFRRSSPSRSSGGSSNSNRSNNNNSPSYQQNRPSYNPGPVIVPYGQPSYNNSSYRSSSSSNAFWNWLPVLIGLGVIGVVIWLALVSRQGNSQAGELDNDTVTVSKVQVALLAGAREVQANLNEISLQIDTDTDEGRAELLQESVLALLRTPEYWSHVSSSSQTVRNRDEAQTLFNQLSVTERGKFSAETLVNVGGRVRQQKAVYKDTEEGAPAYIVVTLLVGTAHDKPLFEEIRTAPDLEAVLKNLAAISSDYLMVFEVLWTPQEDTTSLSYDELLEEFSDMRQIS